MFLDVVKNSFATITQDWVTNLNNDTETFDFRMVGHIYETRIFNSLIGAKKPICKAIFKTSIMQVKRQCFVTTNMFISELD